MACKDGVMPKVQWRWDRFNVRALTTVDYARRNCVGNDCDELETQRDMQQTVIEEQKHVDHDIVSELHELLRKAASITGMTYWCKLTNHKLACTTIKDIRLSWVQDGSQENIQRIAWMFYYYGTVIHQSGRSSLTHNEWVERKVMAAMNVSYVHLAELTSGQRTCVQQLYSKKMSALRSNIMRRSPGMTHTSMIRKEQPKLPLFFNKNFKRSKTTFFVSTDFRNELGWHKVSDESNTMNSENM